jgi:hypothetical protein
MCCVALTHGQDFDHSALLDSAKTLFGTTKGMDQLASDSFDYYKVVTMLDQVLEHDPDNAEAHYFLGYTYSRINSRDGRSMVSMSLDILEKSSQQFETVNRLTPKYTGQVIALDPYSKISAEWGSMAMSYWHSNKPDSAIWAFQEGKRRGGFSKFILDLNRKVLDACSPNAILISSGDNFTIPLWYLQIVEAYRNDVAVIDISLLNTSWYPTFLSENKVVAFDLPNAMLDTLGYSRWTDSTVTIGKFSWTVKPSWYGQYVLRGDRIFLSLLRKNLFYRDVYFTIGFIEQYRLSLGDRLTGLTVVDKLSMTKARQLKFEAYQETMGDLLALSTTVNSNSQGEVDFYNFILYDLMRHVQAHLDKKQKSKAKKLIDLLDSYEGNMDTPIMHENIRRYLIQVRGAF